MQEGGPKLEATGSTRYHVTLRNKVGSDRTSWYIDGLIHLVFVGSQLYLDSMTRTPKSKLYTIALPKYTLSQYIGG